jgi:hypothetical protein
MIDIFKKELNLSKVRCHTGGALGADTEWEQRGLIRGVQVFAYSYKTKYHESPCKVEISEDEYKEGMTMISKANKKLGRYGISKYMNLLARNWSQVKHSDQIFAIGIIVEPGKKGVKGHRNASKYEVVDGGTGYAVQMAIDSEKDVFVFDQNKELWFRWSYNSMRFIQMKETPAITEQNFAGIGTREIKPCGIKAIEDVYIKTFGK